MARKLLFVIPHASLSRPTPQRIQFSKTLQSACDLVTTGARCVVVPRAFMHIPSLTFPEGFDVRDIPLSPKTPTAAPAILRDLWVPLQELARTHCTVSGTETARGRVARVSGTPCPRPHVDKLALRVISTIQGPGTVLLRGAEGNVEYRTQEGDALLMVGVGEDSEFDDGVWHRSPRRFVWMRDRVIIQVDDW